MFRSSKAHFLSYWNNEENVPINVFLAAKIWGEKRAGASLWSSSVFPLWIVYDLRKTNEMTHFKLLLHVRFCLLFVILVYVITPEQTTREDLCVWFASEPRGSRELNAYIKRTRTRYKIARVTTPYVVCIK